MRAITFKFLTTVFAIPFAIAAVWMVLWGHNSDRTGERVWHNALPLAWMII